MEANELVYLNPFWKSSGFTPASLVFREDMQWNLALIASLPGPGIEYLRPHYLLDLVQKPVHGEGWNWSLLDRALDIMTGFGYKLIFEMMGNPGGHFNDFSDPRQLEEWKDFTESLLIHLEERYSSETMQSWYYESWNEPDIDSWWSQWPDPELFCLYWDATAAAFDERAPHLKLGGPGTCKTNSPVLTHFLYHCARESNSVSGAKRVKLDFISVHEKGALENREDIPPSVDTILGSERAALETIRSYAEFVQSPFMNNECDPQTGWQDIHTWRARSFYPAFIAATIEAHLKQFVIDGKINYPVLSSDNAFLGTWGQRTMLNRFMVRSNSGENWRLLFKPVGQFFALAGLMGEQLDQLQSKIDGSIVTTRGKDEVILLTAYNDSELAADHGDAKHFHIEKRGQGGREEIVRIFRIDDSCTQPFTSWYKMGAPEMPRGEQWGILYRSSLLFSENRVMESRSEKGLDIDVPCPGVALVVRISRPVTVPEKVAGVKLRLLKGKGIEEGCLLTWNHIDDLLSLDSYEIWTNTSSDEGEWKMVYDNGMFSAIPIYDIVQGKPLRFKVRARNIKGISGDFSEEVGVDSA